MGLHLEGDASRDREDGAPEYEIELMDDMIEAGASRLDELMVEGPSGLICTSFYAAKEVYLAMENYRRTK